jgi:hypothetical protein
MKMDSNFFESLKMKILLKITARLNTESHFSTFLEAIL